MQFTKGNTIGSASRFGPDWQGKRCGARTKEGIARIVAAKTTHGRLTKEKRLEAKAQAKVGRQVRGEVKDIERWALDLGLLGKDWRRTLKA